MPYIVNSPMNRHERIKTLRIKIILHRRMARHNMTIKGPEHYDTIHEWGIVEELSAALSNEIQLHDIELDAQKRRKHDGWDMDIMDRSYEL